jgi:5-methylcytosine-specific restriction endonuclease McrA
MNHKHRVSHFHRRLTEQGGRCYYCRRLMTTTHVHREGVAPPLDRVTWDHKIPLSMGGKNKLSNKVLACLRCNQLKGSLTDEEFVNDTAMQGMRARSRPH